MSDDDERQVSAEELIDELLRQAVSQLTDGVLTTTRWVLAYEATDGERREVYSVCSNAVAVQDILGMLAYLTIEAQRIANTQLDNRLSGG